MSAISITRDITAARGTEMMMPLWMRLFRDVIGNAHFNYHMILHVFVRVGYIGTTTL